MPPAVGGAVKAEGGGVRPGKREPEKSCEKAERQRNSHSTAHKKCKCIPRQPRDKQAAASFGL